MRWNGPPYSVRRPAITAFPGCPGSGVPTTWPGPFAELAAARALHDDLVEADARDTRAHRCTRRDPPPTGRSSVELGLKAALEPDLVRRARARKAQREHDEPRARPQE